MRALARSGGIATGVAKLAEGRKCSGQAREASEPAQHSGGGTDFSVCCVGLHDGTVFAKSQQVSGSLSRISDKWRIDGID